MRKSVNIKTVCKKAVALLLLIFLSLIFVMPFWWSLLTSVRPNDEIFTSGMRLYPAHIVPDHYQRAMKIIPFLRYTVNTLLITVMIIASNLILCSLAGYAFAKLRFAGRDLVYHLMLFSAMIPGTILLIPQFLILVHFPLAGGNNILGQGGSGFSGTLPGVVLPTAISIFNTEPSNLTYI